MRQRFKHHTEKSKYLNEHINEKGYASIMHITDLEIEKYLKDNKINIEID